MTGILGSGFGLYGYSPAVLLLEGEIALLERAKPKFLNRKELLQYSSRIKWFSNLEYFLKSVQTVIISVPPNEQVEILEYCLHYKNIKKLILEKPIAPDPKTSIKILMRLINANMDFRIGYSFLYTNWYELMKKKIEGNRTNGNIVLNIKWHFEAHHYKENLQNWKRSRSEGGGVLRYYGIHIIAILTDLTMNKIMNSKLDCYSDDDCYKWNFICSDIFGNTGIVEIDTNSMKEEFSINIVNSKNDKDEYFSFSASSPFESEPYLHFDQRVKPLKMLYSDLISRSMNETDKDFYEKVNFFWDEIENKSKFD